MALPQYDALRRRLDSEYATKKSEASDALQRRFASQGMLNSGAYQKTLGIQDEALNRQQADARGTVDFQELGEEQRQKEVADQRAFQTSERVAGQDFSKGMFDQEFGFKQKQYANENEWRAKEFEQDKMNNWLTQLVNMDADFDDPQEMRELMARLSAMGIRAPGDTNNYQVR